MGARESSDPRFDLAFRPSNGRSSNPVRLGELPGAHHPVDGRPSKAGAPLDFGACQQSILRFRRHDTRPLGSLSSVSLPLPRDSPSHRPGSIAPAAWTHSRRSERVRAVQDERSEPGPFSRMGTPSRPVAAQRPRSGTLLGFLRIEADAATAPDSDPLAFSSSMVKARAEAADRDRRRRGGGAHRHARAVRQPRVVDTVGLRILVQRARDLDRGPCHRLGRQLRRLQRADGGRRARAPTVTTSGPRWPGSCQPGRSRADGTVARGARCTPCSRRRCP